MTHVRISRPRGGDGLRACDALRNRPAAALATLLWLGSQSGCSLLFVDAPPPNHAQLRHFDCTSSKAAPIIDTVIGGYQVVRTAVALSAEDSDYGSYPISRGADIAFGLGLSTLFIASAVYGFSTTGDCSDAEDALARRSLSRPESYDGAAARPLVVGCTTDAQCKADRVCEAGRCVDPLPPAPPAAPLAPPPAAPDAPSPTAPAPAPAVPAPASPPPA